MTTTEQFLQEREARKNLSIELQAHVNRLVDLLRRQFELEGELARVRHDAREIAEKRIFNGNFLTTEIPGQPRYFVTIADGVAQWHEVNTPGQWADDVLERDRGPLLERGRDPQA